MMSLTFGLFTQVSGSGPLGPLVFSFFFSLLDCRSLFLFLFLFRYWFESFIFECSVKVYGIIHTNNSRNLSFWSSLVQLH